MSDRRSVLLDLLAECAPPQHTPKSNAGFVDVGNGRGPKRQHSGMFEGTGKIDAILATLKANPRIPILDLAAKVYGSNDKNGAAKTRSLLFTLKKKGRVRSPSHGLWEVT